jgi:iron complex transport system substrate-binding protein
VKIISLLPSATEIVYALELGDDLQGVSYECDHPPDARTKAIVSGTALPIEQQLSSADIDQEVSSRIQAGESIYTLDRERIRAIAPDLILAQDLCEVCAVPSGAVEEALDALGCQAQVVSLDPAGLDDIIGCIGTVGAATGTDELADQVMSALRQRVDEVRSAVEQAPTRSVLALEWYDPPFSAGHWVPEMIQAAGGVSLLAGAGERSRRLDWDEIAGSGAEVVAFMPCGYRLDASTAEGQSLTERPELSQVAEVWAVDGDAYFSRPGPRVVDGVELLASILHPDRVGPVDGSRAVRLR